MRGAGRMPLANALVFQTENRLKPLVGAALRLTHYCTSATSPASLFFGLFTRADTRCAIVNRIFNERHKVSGKPRHQPLSRAATPPAPRA